MIRYLLAIVLAVALLGIALSAVETGATMASEQAVESQISTIELEATELVETEEPPRPGQDGPTRTLELTLPSDGFVSESVTRFAVIPNTESNRSTVSYQVGGGRLHTVSLDVPVGTDAGTRLLLNGESGTFLVELELTTTSDGRPLVSLSVV